MLLDPLKCAFRVPTLSTQAAEEHSRITPYLPSRSLYTHVIYCPFLSA